MCKHLQVLYSLAQLASVLPIRTNSEQCFASLDLRGLQGAMTLTQAIHTVLHTVSYANVADTPE